MRRLASPAEIAQFLRFFLTGIIATCANLSAVWIFRLYTDYQQALVAGVLTGMTVSFVMSKLFAFRSRSWDGAGGEMARFMVVYGAGVILFLVVSLLFGGHLLPRLMSRAWAELIGAFLGSSTMMFSSYFGHRFFTYRK